MPTIFYDPTKINRLNIDEYFLPSGDLLQLLPGFNIVSQFDWDTISTNPHTQCLLTAGSIEVVPSTGDEASTLSYSLNDALRFVRGTYDSALIQQNLVTENRADVRAALEYQCVLIRKANIPAASKMNPLAMATGQIYSIFEQHFHPGWSNRAAIGA
ncbi:hypothetical protein ACN4EG_25180 [Alkalinema pantanalense CENA528]|uniref:hypothetical protein n=1 Tax=Alkalinema pantanalense TaxID=1620705 RepID=UPI003D6DEB41